MSYILPPASANQLGGVKVGRNLTIDEDGILNAAGIDELNNKLTTCLTDIEQGKIEVARAISDKGVPTEYTNSFNKISANIRAIPVGDTSGCLSGTVTLSTDVFQSNLITEVTHDA